MKCRQCLWIAFVAVVVQVQGFPYANDYPYEKYEYGKRDQSAEGAADRSAFSQNKLSDEANNHKAMEDLSKFYNIENLSNGHNLQHSKKGASTSSQKETTGEDFENDKSHKRKHIKSGFRNSYHKDESGSNSSYYEDSDDRGGKVVYDKRHGVRGDSNGSEYNEGRRDGSNRDKYDNRSGGHDNRGTHDRQQYLAQDKGGRHGHRDGYVQGEGSSYNQGSNDYRDGGMRNGRPHGSGNRDWSNRGGYASHNNRLGPFMENSLSVSDNYNRPSHYDSQAQMPYDGGLHTSLSVRPLDGGGDDYYSRHRITIYEDPREWIDPRHQSDRRRNDFPITGERSSLLEFRPSPMRRRFTTDHDEGYRYQRRF